MGKKISLLCGNPAVLNQDSLLEYKELTIRYPYCQCARLMFLLNLKQIEDQAAYKSALPLTAINLPDRVRLKEHVERLQPAAPDPIASVPRPHTQANDPLPRRHVESFSPWSQALPKSRQTIHSQNNTGFTPIVPPSQEKQTRTVKVEEVRTLLTKSSRSSGRIQADANALIDRFLSGKSEHTIRIDENFDYNSFDPDTGHSNREDFSFGSETLAQMYLKNNAPGKAIAVYENLRLKFPEKSSYFANLIKEVKKVYHIK